MKENTMDDSLLDTLAKEDEDDNDYITLCSENGQDIEFIEIAGITYKNNFYAVLQPVEPLDGMGEDEALVFKIVKGNDGNDSFQIELDQDIIDIVFDEYQKLVKEANDSENDSDDE
ncbi:MAG: DUF1292 domain-containing protein [Clostridia bacterium]